MCGQFCHNVVLSAASNCSQSGAGPLYAHGVPACVDPLRLPCLSVHPSPSWISYSTRTDILGDDDAVGWNVEMVPAKCTAGSSALYTALL